MSDFSTVDSAAGFYIEGNRQWEEVDNPALADFENSDWFYEYLRRYNLISFANVWPRLDKTFFDLFVIACEKKGTIEGVESIIWALFGRQALIRWEGPNFDPVAFKGSGWARAIVTNTNQQFSYALATADVVPDTVATVDGMGVLITAFQGAFDTVMTDFVRQFIPLGCHFEMTQA